jgi:hypothetical protein
VCDVFLSVGASEVESRQPEVLHMCDLSSSGDIPLIFEAKWSPRLSRERVRGSAAWCGSAGSISARKYC